MSLRLLEDRNEMLRIEPVGEVLLPHEAAKYLRVSLRTLDRLHIGRSKIGHRTVRYKKADLDAFLSAHREVA